MFHRWKRCNRLLTCSLATNPKVFLFDNKFECWILQGNINKLYSSKEEITWGQDECTHSTAIILDESNIPASTPLSPSSLAALGAHHQHRLASGHSVASGSRRSAHSANSGISVPLTTNSSVPASDTSPVPATQQMCTHIISALQVTPLLADGLRHKGVDLEWSGVLHKRYPTLISEIIMELFLSKGHFHRYWNKLFSPLSHYPVLEAWFNHEPSALTPTSIKAWGSSKNKPKFADLEKCLMDLGATWVGTKFVPLHSNLDSSSSSSQSIHNTHYMSSNDKKKKKKKKK
ncbi:hypothetical protein FA15DRAFT_711011 [Coprinopsis marcescibilis]|uniref:Uncharacterized protein n=1 Tax=Coprinopsis marcescibilis TaxID=230819 RepID=A0A5C3KAW6_COPMA|nr:hypothetical protein FA15DRAFT_711011 [Coprinopsis marcescibilis]